MTAINTQEYIEKYIEIVSAHLDRKINAFGYKYRCGEFGKTLPSHGRILLREDIAPTIKRVPGVVSVALGVNATYIPIIVRVEKHYFNFKEGYILEEIRKDIVKELSQKMPQNLKFSLNLIEN